MAKVILNNRHTVHEALTRAYPGPSRDFFHITDALDPSDTGSVTVTLQVSLLESAELVKAEGLGSGGSPLTAEQVQLLRQYAWDRAPSWANYAAVNEDGSGAWFAAKPVLDESRGRWAFSYEDRRSWPMFSTVRLMRPWRESLRQRPVPSEPGTPSVRPGPCLQLEGDIVTDVIGYIEVTLGNMQVVPDCTWPNCDCYSTSAEQPPEAPTGDVSDLPSATIVVEVSNDSVEWADFSQVVVSSGTPSEGLTLSISWPYFRLYLRRIVGKNAFVRSTIGVL